MMQIMERRRIERRTFERRRMRQAEGHNHTGIYLCDFCNHDATTRKDDINYHLQDAFHCVSRITLQLFDAGLEYTHHFFKEKISTRAAIVTEKQAIQVHWHEYLYEHLHLVGEVIGVVLTVLGGLAFALVAFCFAVFPGNSQHDSLRDIERENKKRRHEEEEEDRKRDDDAYEVQHALDRADLHRPLDGRYDTRELRDYDHERGKVVGVAYGVMNGSATRSDFARELDSFQTYSDERWRKQQDERQRREEE